MAVAEEDLFSPFPNWREWGTGSLGLVGTALGEEARLTTVGRASASCSWPNLAVWTRRSGGGPAARQWKRTRIGDRREGGRGRGVVVSRARPAMGKSGGGGACCLFCVLETLARFLPAKVGPFFVCHAAGACFRDLHSPSSFQNKKGKKTERGLHFSSARASNIFVQLSVLSEGKST